MALAGKGLRARLRLMKLLALRVEVLLLLWSHLGKLQVGVVHLRSSTRRSRTQSEAVRGLLAATRTCCCESGPGG